MGSVELGEGGYVTPKGWVQIHNPGSTTKTAVFGVWGGWVGDFTFDAASSSLNIGENMKEISDPGGLCLRAARTALGTDQSLP
jgi:hypothetical protein